MILGIDTSEINVTKVYLKDGSGKIVKMAKSERKPGSQVLIPTIVKILKSQKLNFKNLSGVEVNEGPGSFTGLKVGISVANAIGAALKIPVNSKKVGQLVYPKYE